MPGAVVTGAVVTGAVVTGAVVTGAVVTGAVVAQLVPPKNAEVSDVNVTVDSVDASATSVIEWFAMNARPLPWRAEGTSPWGVLVSEVMAQQTPVARVAPQWQSWIHRWPRASALAAASTADVLNAWDRLGYPRRALRLHATAALVAHNHDDEVPKTYEQLRALPGVGDYTAAAVLAFAFGRRALVLDTNIRRVVSRVFAGQAIPRSHITRAERELIDLVTPGSSTAENPNPVDEVAARWSVAVMELGALVCTPTPNCTACPLKRQCRWRAANYPESLHQPRRSQPFHGTDRQIRGRIMKALRDASPIAVSPAELCNLVRQAGGAADETPLEQYERALASLLTDGLVEKTKGGQVSLPTFSPMETD
jgi:A/G-specific adenine glycosylase